MIIINSLSASSRSRFYAIDKLRCENILRGPAIENIARKNVLKIRIALNDACLFFSDQSCDFILLINSAAAMLLSHVWSGKRKKARIAVRCTVLRGSTTTRLYMRLLLVVVTSLQRGYHPPIVFVSFRD